MLDIKWIISNPDKADELFAKRGIKPIARKLIKMSQSRSNVIFRVEKLLKKRNILSKKIIHTKDKKDKDNVINEVKKIKNQIEELQSGSLHQTSLYKELIQLPNFLDGDVPIGKSDNDNKEIKKYGKIKEFDSIKNTPNSSV